MLKVLIGKSDVLKYQEIFDDLLSEKLNERIENQIGFQGGARWEEISYSISLGLWYATSMDVGGAQRVWNSFGFQNPNETNNLNIAVEINFPFNRKGDVNGVFLEDEAGNIYVGHRGLVNIGGRKSIKDIYKQYFNDVYECEDDYKNSEIIIISPLRSDKLAENIKMFVNRIVMIKEEKRNQQIGGKSRHELVERNEFTLEPTTRKPAIINQIIEYNLEHGRIVNQLKEVLSNSAHIENNKNIDLFIRNTSGQATHIFEVKTALDTTSIYSAIGQLFFHALSFNPPPKKVFVCPNKIDKTLSDKLKELSIDIITFSIKEDNYIFKGLDRFL